MTKTTISRIIVENKSPMPLEIEILGSAKCINNPAAGWNSDGNIDTDKYSIRSALPDTTYRDILYQIIKDNSWVIGTTRFVIQNGFTRWAHDYLNKSRVQTEDKTGVIVTVGLALEQDRKNVFINEVTYRVDARTSLFIFLPHGPFLVELQLFLDEDHK